MKKRPLVVIVFPVERTPTSPRYGGFAQRLQRASGLKGCEVVTVALENLAFIVDEAGGAMVVDTDTGCDIGRADLVYLKSWETMPDEAGALAIFLQHKGIPFMDTAAAGAGTSKLVTTFRLWARGISAPLTLYVRRPDRLLQVLGEGWAEKLGDKFIVKDCKGAKGKLNFLVSAGEVAGIIAGNPDIQFFCQRFIPNDGDYRIGIYGRVPRFVIKRVGTGNTHLNNTSTGGVATYIPVHELPRPLLVLAEQAAAAAELQVAGIDIIIDKDTAVPYVLEANKGSQIVTGAFASQNIRAFNDAMEDVLRKRHARPLQRPLRTIGRRAQAALPELGIERAIAKIDTGAYSSTLHAHNIRLEANATGEEVLAFDIAPGSRLHISKGTPTTIRLKDYFVRLVRSSNGHAEHRYCFKTTLVIEGESFVAVITLGDRSSMEYPLLIGRHALRSRFMVNVELDEGFNETRG